MAKRRRLERVRTRTRRVYERAQSYRRRTLTRDRTMRDLRKAGIGAGVGLAVSIPLTLAARHWNQPIMMEAGQRIGAIAATILGQTPGQVAYQAADALFDRFVRVRGNAISGTQGGMGV